jgi:hypothetical protein
MKDDGDVWVIMLVAALLFSTDSCARKVLGSLCKRSCSGAVIASERSD